MSSKQEQFEKFISNSRCNGYLPFIKDSCGDWSLPEHHPDKLLTALRVNNPYYVYAFGEHLKGTNNIKGGGTSSTLSFCVYRHPVDIEYTVDNVQRLYFQRQPDTNNLTFKSLNGHVENPKSFTSHAGFEELTLGKGG